MVGADRSESAMTPIERMILEGNSNAARAVRGLRPQKPEPESALPLLAHALVAMAGSKRAAHEAIYAVNPS